MTAATTPARTYVGLDGRATAPPVLTFRGAVLSEWIKLRTLRSTLWCYLLVVVLNIGLGFLIAGVTAGVGGSAAMSHDTQQRTALQVATLGISFSELVCVVLGALVITGEYGTGMIRSTLTAVPRRVEALVAKALVFAVTTFAIGFVSVVATAITTAPLLRSKGIRLDFADGHNWAVVFGGAGFLSLIGLLAFGVGAILRNGPGGIATSLGLVLVLPTVLGVIAGVANADWARHLLEYLPSSAGGRMYDAVQAPGSLVLEPWMGTLVLVAWSAVAGAIAAILVKRRDV